MYIPSGADKLAGEVTLLLSTTGNGGCSPAVSPIKISFQSLPVVNAGPDQSVCVNDANINLAGQVSGAGSIIWKSSGTGTFTPSNTSLNAVYVASRADILNKVVVLTLISADNGACAAVSDEMQIIINPLPVVDAGPDLNVLEKTMVTLQPKLNETDVTFEWSPRAGLSDYRIKNPVFSALESQTYVIRVTNKWGCVTEDSVSVTVLKPIQIPNTFTPNGDGINDVWNISELENYPEATVNVYNRYGAHIFGSVRYTQPWDGTYRGKPLPDGVYYYVIDTMFPGQVFSGSITILR